MILFQEDDTSVPLGQQACDGRTGRTAANHENVAFPADRHGAASEDNDKRD
jgi:hypothetical protein